MWSETDVSGRKKQNKKTVIESEKMLTNSSYCQNLDWLEKYNSEKKENSYRKYVESEFAMYFSIQNILLTKTRKTKNYKHRLSFGLLVLIFVSCCSSCCDGRLFGNIPPSRGGGGILFGAAGEGGGNVRDRVQPGPGIGKQPPQNILGRFHTKDEEEEEKKVDPRHPPKTARMRLGPILFDPEHLVSRWFWIIFLM